MGYMGYHCFLLFKYGLPVGFFCAYPSGSPQSVIANSYDFVANF